MGLLALVAIALYPWVGYVAFLAYKRGEGWLGNTITLVIAYFGALSVAFAVGLSSDPSLKFPLIYRIPLLFAGSFLIGLRWAIAATPPLPRVVITKQPGGVMEGLPTSTEGHLVVHSDGFWHLFEDNGELLSLPDAQVLDIRVLRKADRSPAKEEGKQTVTRRPWRALIPWRALLIAAVVLGPGFIWGVLRLFSFT
jgi:hypothetical protein